MGKPVILLWGLLAWAGAAVASPLSADEWREDIAALEAGIAEMHPNPFHTVSREEFGAASARLAAQAGSMSEAEMVAGLAELVAMLGEGHSRLSIPIAGLTDVGAGHAEDEQPRIEPFSFLPIQLMRAGADYVVIRASTGNSRLLGARLVAIEGVAVPQLIERISPLINADSPAERLTRLGDFLLVPELLRARGIGDGQTLRWTFQSPAGATLTADLAPVRSGNEWRGGAPYPEAPEGAPSRVNWVSAIGRGRVLVRLGEIGDQPEISMTALAEEARRLLDAENDPALIFDLRGNPGGDNSQIDALVRLAIRDERLWRPGRLFVLIDGRTHSAAMNLANQLDRWTPAIFVGSPTAASPNSYGDARQLQLPNSRLTARISTLYWQDGGPQDQRVSISPEISAPFTQASIAQGDDPALETIATILASPPGIPGRFAGTAAISGYDLAVTIDLAARTFEVEGLTRGAVPIDDLAIGDDGSVTGSLAIVGTVPLTMRIAGDWLVGHAEVRGRVYALALRRAD